MKKKIILISLLILIANSLYPLDRVSRSLAVLGVSSARDLGMAGMSFPIVDDSTSVIINPSMMADISHSGVNANYSYNSLSDHGVMLSYVQKIGNFAFGFGLQSYISPINTHSATEVPSADVYGEYALSFAASYKINDKVFIGGNIKAIYTGDFTSGMESGFGMAFDLTATMITPIPFISASFGLKDFGFYNSTFADFDPQVIAAIGLTPNSDTIFNISIVGAVDVPSFDFTYGAAVEVVVFSFNKKKNETINMDDPPESILDGPVEQTEKVVNYSMKLRSGVNNNGLSVGLGFNLSLFKLDYGLSFDDYSFTQITHSLSFGFQF